MKRTVFCAALLLAAGCSSPKKNRTVDPLRVETIVAAPSADVGAAVYVGAIEEESSAALSFPVAGTVARTFADEGPARRQRSPARRARSHLGAPDFRGRRSRAESGEGRLRASETALRRREPARDQVGRGADPAAAAEAAFGIAKKNLEDCSLYAPFSGWSASGGFRPGRRPCRAFPC